MRMACCCGQHVAGQQEATQHDVDARPGPPSAADASGIKIQIQPPSGGDHHATSTVGGTRNGATYDDRNEDRGRTDERGDVAREHSGYDPSFFSAVENDTENEISSFPIAENKKVLPPPADWYRPTAPVLLSVSGDEDDGAVVLTTAKSSFVEQDESRPEMEIEPAAPPAATSAKANKNGSTTSRRKQISNFVSKRLSARPMQTPGQPTQADGEGTTNLMKKQSSEEEDFGLGPDEELTSRSGKKRKNRKMHMLKSLAFLGKAKRKTQTKEEREKQKQLWAEMTAKRLKEGNPNKVLDYYWLRPLVDALSADPLTVELVENRKLKRSYSLLPPLREREKKDHNVEQTGREGTAAFGFEETQIPLDLVERVESRDPDDDGGNANEPLTHTKSDTSDYGPQRAQAAGGAVGGNAAPPRSLFSPPPGAQAHGAGGAGAGPTAATPSASRPCSGVFLQKGFAPNTFPLFLFAGACPSAVTRNMQAILFVYTFPPKRRASRFLGGGGRGGGEKAAALKKDSPGLPGGGTIDFWWVKPEAGGRKLDYNYLQKHESGRWKNVCGSQTRGGYEQIADYFRKNAVVGNFKFGIEIVEREDGSKVPKAYVESRNTQNHEGVGGGGGTRVSVLGGVTTTDGSSTTNHLTSDATSSSARGYIALIWQENWAALMGRFIEGRIVYRCRLYEDGPNLRSREYHIKGDKPIVLRNDFESVPFSGCFEEDGVDKIKTMCAGVEWKTAPGGGQLGFGKYNTM